MKTVLMLVFMAGLTLSASAQKARLELKKGRIEKGTTTINLKQTLQLMEAYPEAYAYMKKANTNSNVAGVFAALGGGLIGWPIGTAIGGGDPNWSLAAIGGGLVIVALPFHSAFKKNASMAIELYNAADHQALHHDVKLNIGLLERGFGIKVSF